MQKYIQFRLGVYCLGLWSWKESMVANSKDMRWLSNQFITLIHMQIVGEILQLQLTFHVMKPKLTQKRHLLSSRQTRRGSLGGSIPSPMQLHH